MKIQITLLLAASVLLSGCGPSEAEKTTARLLEEYKIRKQKEKAKLQSLYGICRRRLKMRLKDPESYRELSAKGRILPEMQPATYDNGRKVNEPYDGAVTLSYTATNSYGGRIKNEFLCSFQDRRIVWVF